MMSPRLNEQQRVGQVGKVSQKPDDEGDGIDLREDYGKGGERIGAPAHREIVFHAANLGLRESFLKAKRVSRALSRRSSLRLIRRRSAG